MLASRAAAATIAALVLLAAATSTALADAVAIPGSPLSVYVGERGQLQAFRGGQPPGIYFAPSATEGDAGFFLAFPTPSNAGSGVDGNVFGFDGSAGPHLLTDYTPLTQGTVTGAGTGASPYTQVTTYSAGANIVVTQTTTYVNGTQQFGVVWDVKNNTGSTITFKALTAADFYFDGSDRGTGIFTQGPPRFVGGTNADTGNSGGFAELLGPPINSPAWSAYEALAYGSSGTEVWGKIETAAASATATFNDQVVAEQVDNAGGVEWDNNVLANGSTAHFAIVARSAVPSALQISPPNGGSPRGVPINYTVTGTNTDGVPYAGKVVRYTIVGANPASGQVTTDASGSAVITDPGTNAGADTITAFIDFNNDGVRQALEPQASALGTFVDNVAPSCKVKVTGDRPGGSGGAGKPLVITVTCNEQATVTVQTSLSPVGSSSRAAAASVDKKRKKHKKVVIRLKTTTKTVGPGQSVPVSFKLPKSVARRYAGKTLRATITVTARDSSGNVKKTKTVRSIKVAKLKRKHH